MGASGVGAGDLARAATAERSAAHTTERKPKLKRLIEIPSRREQPAQRDRTAPEKVSEKTEALFAERENYGPLVSPAGVSGDLWVFGAEG